MPRRAAAQQRPVEADPVHRSKLVQQVINRVMLDGKKSTSERIVYDALAILSERTGKDPVEALETSIKALTPVLEVRSRRVGGATYQVPVEVRTSRRQALGIRWIIAERTGREPVEALENSIKTLTPVLEVRSRRVGGATYQVPVEVPARRARTLAVRWLVEFARQRREKTMAQRLANELLDAQSQQGGAYKRKDDIFRMAQANKAFAHYRW